MAGRLNTSWYVVYVETPKEDPLRIDATAQRHLAENVDRARELGAEVVRLRGRDPVRTLLEFARSHGVGHLVVGRSHKPIWRQLLERSLVLRLLQEARDLDLHLVALEDPEDPA